MAGYGAARDVVKREEFYAWFERGFAPGAAAADLVRSRGRALKWTHRDADGRTLTFAFRLNRKNLPDYPGEFMPDIFWSGPRAGPRDTGEISFYQYTLPQEADAVSSLQKRVIEEFVVEMQLEAQLKEPGSLVQLLAEMCELEIRPNHDRWLPYWNAEDATAWGSLFGASMRGWVSRFLARPETREAWCWRVLWSKS